MKHERRRAWPLLSRYVSGEQRTRTISLLPTRISVFTDRVQCTALPPRASWSVRGDSKWHWPSGLQCSGFRVEGRTTSFGLVNLHIVVTETLRCSTFHLESIRIAVQNCFSSPNMNVPPKRHHFETPFHKRQVGWRNNLPPVTIVPRLTIQGLPPRQKPRRRKHIVPL
jgi:hypothetical protein